MNFIRAIQNQEDLILDEEVEKFLEELENIDIDQIDEDAFDRIAKRVEARDLALYRMIVGTQNMMLTKKFLDLAQEGKSIPNSVVKGYLPAIEMLHDIVTAGPGFVQLLKVLHKRAKNSR